MVPDPGRLLFRLLALLCLLAAGSPAPPPPPRAIPHTLHQVTVMPSRCPREEMAEVVPGRFLHAVLADIIFRLRRLNPHWSYRLWDHRSISRFLQLHRAELNRDLQLEPGEDVKDIYDSINPHYGAARSDFFRYVVLYLLGGVYLDLKSFCRIPLDELLQPDDRLVVVDWDPKRFYGWGEWPDDIPGRGREHMNGFIAAAPRHPALHAVLLRLLRQYRRYTPYCLELHECPSGMLYRFKADSSFDATFWPRKQWQCYGRGGTLVMTGPVVFTSAILAIQQQASPSAPPLGIRVLQANTTRDVVADFRAARDLAHCCPERRKLYCTSHTYHTLKEPIYLPLPLALGLWNGTSSIPPEPADSLDCPPAPPQRPPS
eukprot:EG_transcript_5858